MTTRLRPRRSALVALAALAALGLTAAACGDDGDDDPSAGADAATAEATTAPPGDAPADVVVELTDSDLGPILTSGGRTLYAFVPDGGNGSPTCNDDCAANWPALAAPTDIAVGDGLDTARFTSVARSDGGPDQLAVDGWPLYFFANDAGPGDTNGQGVGGNWFVVGADGAMIQAASSGAGAPGY